MKKVVLFLALASVCFGQVQSFKIRWATYKDSSAHTLVLVDSISGKLIADFRVDMPSRLREHGVFDIDLDGSVKYYKLNLIAFSDDGFMSEPSETYILINPSWVIPDTTTNPLETPEVLSIEPVYLERSITVDFIYDQHMIYSLLLSGSVDFASSITVNAGNGKVYTMDHSDASDRQMATIVNPTPGEYRGNINNTTELPTIILSLHTRQDKYSNITMIGVLKKVSTWHYRVEFKF